MTEKPVAVERIGVEHVSEGLRHGSPRRTFTIWFAANLTIADYVIGVLVTTAFGASLAQAVPILLLGNLFGGLLLGLAAAMGPSLGFPQMLSSRSSFGRLGNYLPGGLNWISTVGWFAVNTILAVVALRVIFPEADFAVAAGVYVLIQSVIAIYGHDFIHLFEKVMSIVLGLLFLLIFVLAIPKLGSALAYVPGSTSAELTVGSAGIIFVVSFSYLMSWSPYASDYSRYLQPSTSRRKVAIFALAGGALSSFAVEVIGAVIGSLNPLQTNYFSGLYAFAGAYGAIAMTTLILGAFAADALNLYTNSLSALVLDVKAARWKTVAAGGLVGLAISVAVGTGFENFYENFLLALSYWIMPWLAIVLVDYYLVRSTKIEKIEKPVLWDWQALGAYGLAILVSVPFMVLPFSFGFPVGALSYLFGGADLSYFVSFGVAFALTFLIRRRLAGASSPRKFPVVTRQGEDPGDSPFR